MPAAICICISCRGPRAVARWPVVGARRPHAGAVGRRLRAREPHRGRAQSAGSFPRLQVQRLALLFRAHARRLMALAPTAGRTEPRVVLLTPGPYNETYFEHAYLARYLGFTLVEGGGSDGARPSRLSSRPLSGARAGRRHLAPPRRRLLRSARAARAIVARRRRPGRGGARRQRDDRQRAGQRRARGHGVQAISAGAAAKNCWASRSACPMSRAGGAAAPTNCATSSTTSIVS